MAGVGVIHRGFSVVVPFVNGIAMRSDVMSNSVGSRLRPEAKMRIVHATWMLFQSGGLYG